MVVRERHSSDELWRRVRGLEGQIVYTLKRREPNAIENVTDNTIVIRDRRSRPSRESVEEVYNLVWADGEFRVYEGRQGVYVYAVVPAIVLAAAPEQLERVDDGGLTGIRLRRAQP
jgi:hypothetical protein